MKTVILIRHAKAVPEEFNSKDIFRSLHQRGHENAIILRGRLKQVVAIINCFITSSAKRTQQTTEIFQQIYPNATIQIEPALYHCSPEVYERIITSQNNSSETIALVGHNPTITEFINQLDAGLSIDNLPTCGIVVVQANIDDWSHFLNGEKEVLYFDYPKKGL